jgi:hypothetical protein
MSKLDEINTATAVPLLTSVSLGIAPDSILNHGPTLADVDGPGATIYTNARKALGSMHVGLGAIEDAVATTRAAHAVTTVVDGAKVRGEIDESRKAQLAADLGSRFSRVAATVDRCADAIDQDIATLSEIVERALVHPRKDTPSVVQEASDIRRYVASLPAAERGEFLRLQAASGDIEIVQACLATSPFVSGIRPENANIIRETLKERLVGDTYRKLNAAIKVRDHVQNAGTLFAKRFREVLPIPKVTANAKAMAALKEGA